MPPALTPTWAITAAAGQPPSTIRLRNLQSTARVGRDAWGRPNRAQPLLVSASVSLVRRPASSSSSDTVDADTVHYGLLSKAILSTLDEVDARTQGAAAAEPVSLRGLLDDIWRSLTGLRVDGSSSPAAADDARKPFLDLGAVRCLSVSVELPKASLAGGCVGLTGTALFDGGAAADMYGVCLGFRGLRVPTLIGINDNEREARQVVVADVEIDCFEGDDVYVHLEKAIYDNMAESSFGTLEALAVALAEALREAGRNPPGAVATPPSAWRIKIGLEKPIAVPLAEGAGIEFVSDPVSQS